ncbi:hypothetical protein ABZ153_31920 [Streptomyces sp. NPDC006290]|uniref:hypothetical protein n=1 Tax=Streptomyces sp. NPDC006290 TaxID=3156745 RepID=UPI0033A4E7AC
MPDFLTPAEASRGLDSGLDTILGTPPARVRHEIGLLAQVRNVPADVYRLADHDVRTELVAVLRKCHNAVIAPTPTTCRPASTPSAPAEDAICCTAEPRRSSAD